MGAPCVGSVSENLDILAAADRRNSEPANCCSTSQAKRSEHSDIGSARELLFQALDSGRSLSSLRSAKMQHFRKQPKSIVEYLLLCTWKLRVGNPPHRSCYAAVTFRFEELSRVVNASIRGIASFQGNLNLGRRQPLRHTAGSLTYRSVPDAGTRITTRVLTTRPPRQS